MTPLEQLLPPATLQRLHAEAERTATPIAEMLTAAVETYLNGDDESDADDTPDEEIEASIRQSIREMKAGLGRPIEEFWAELDREDAADNG